jgi:hypothetical protein
MALYPDSIKYQNPVTIQAEQNVLISSFGDQSREQRKLKTSWPTRNIRIDYKNISISDMNTLLKFQTARGFQYELFTFIYPIELETQEYDGEYIGTGDGSTATFNCPFKEASDYTIYVNNIEQTLTTDYAVSGSFGLDGVDTLTFETASIPASGEVIKADFTGRLAVRCRYNKPMQVAYRSWGNVSLCSASVELKGRHFDE